MYQRAEFEHDIAVETLRKKFQHSHRLSDNEFSDCEEIIINTPLDPLVHFSFFGVGGVGNPRPGTC